VTTQAAHGSHRLFTVDALKGFAISCVVLGHAILRTVPEPADNSVYLLLSAFEMPLFMFLSGFVLPGRVRGSLVVWIRKRAVRLMVPFFAWHAIFFLSRRVGSFGDQTLRELGSGLGSYLATTFASPTAGLWYLPALLLCSLGLAVFFPLRTRPLLLAGAGWSMFAALLWFRGIAGIDGDYGLLKTSTYWLFFAAGYAWGEWKLPLQPARPLARWTPALLYPLIAVPAMRLAPALGAAGGGFAKVVLGLLGTGFSAVLIEMGEPVARWLKLDVLGRYTLGVYCVQWLFLRVMFGEGVFAVAASFLFTLTGSIAATWAISRIPVVKGVLLGEWPRQVRPAGESPSS
jgi:fucose 4-O-acetylase-like acetyltransferase